MHLTIKQIDELYFATCWNSVICRLFGYHKCESVNAILFCLGRPKLNIKHLISFTDTWCIRFYECVLNVLVHNFKHDDMLMTVFGRSTVHSIMCHCHFRLS